MRWFVLSFVVVGCAAADDSTAVGDDNLTSSAETACVSAIRQEKSCSLNGHTILPDAVGHFWATNGGVRMFGLPIGDVDHGTGGGSTQWFERAQLRFDGATTSAAPLGRQWLEAHGLDPHSFDFLTLSCPSGIPDRCNAVAAEVSGARQRGCALYAGPWFAEIDPINTVCPGGLDAKDSIDDAPAPVRTPDVLAFMRELGGAARPPPIHLSPDGVGDDTYRVNFGVPLTNAIYLSPSARDRCASLKSDYPPDACEIVAIDPQLPTTVDFIQVFENVVVEHHPSSKGTPYEFQLALLGNALKP